MMTRSFIILLADDDPADQQAFRWAVEDHDEDIQLEVVADGDVALKYLFGQGLFADEERYPRPDVVVVDLNMPHVTGFAVLNALRVNPNLTDIPVIVMSNSSRPSDKIQTRGLGAREYCLKPRSRSQYKSVLDLVVQHAKNHRDHPDNR